MTADNENPQSDYLIFSRDENMENDNPKKLKELRDRAEQLFSERPEDFKDIPAEDIQNIIHELQVHQIELEMQNEELRRAQLELEASRSRYVDFYDFAPVGYFSISEKGMILEANLTGATMLGVDRGLLTGIPFTEFINREDQDAYYHHRRQLIETKNKQTCGLCFVKKGRGSIPWANGMYPSVGC